MSYSNSAAENPNGTLEYQNSPAYLFSWTLQAEVLPPVGEYRGSSGSSIPADSGFVPGNCQWLVIVDATSGSVIEAGTVCPGINES
jgi:hypothetical protein